MAAFKKLLAFALTGCILGALAASFIAPGLIAWYNEPGFAAPQGFNLAPFAREVIASVYRAQLIGARYNDPKWWLYLVDLPPENAVIEGIPVMTMPRWSTQGRQQCQVEVL